MLSIKLWKDSEKSNQKTNIVEIYKWKKYTYLDKYILKQKQKTINKKWHKLI